MTYCASVTDELRLQNWRAHCCGSATVTLVFDLLWLRTQPAPTHELCFNSPSLNIQHQANFSLSFVALFFFLSPLTAVEIQKNNNRSCLCIKESKQVKKQLFFSPDAMLVSLQTPLSGVYSGGSLRSLHYPPSLPRDPAVKSADAEKKQSLLTLCLCSSFSVRETYLTLLPTEGMRSLQGENCLLWKH